MTTPQLSSPCLRSIATALGGPQAEDRVVVERVVLERAVVDRLVAVVGQPAGQVGLQVEPGVVGAEVDAHGGHPVSGPPLARRKAQVCRIACSEAGKAACRQ